MAKNSTSNGSLPRFSDDTFTNTVLTFLYRWFLVPSGIMLTIHILVLLTVLSIIHVFIPYFWGVEVDRPLVCSINSGIFVLASLVIYFAFHHAWVMSENNNTKRGLTQARESTLPVEENTSPQYPGVLQTRTIIEEDLTSEQLPIGITDTGDTILLLAPSEGRVFFPPISDGPSDNKEVVRNKFGFPEEGEVTSDRDK